VKLKELGFIVYGAARRVERTQAVFAAGVQPISIDVTDDASMLAGVERIIPVPGRVDVLVNNVGYGSSGAPMDVSLDEGRNSLEVNVFGAVRMTQLMLPHMRLNAAAL
jgi:NAD(P)-dependent dehydrogenase (short-subunit alcohol dehydrogenase family)